MLPRARTHKLTVRELPDEILIFDHQASKAHCLNRTAAVVWKHCDGQTTIRELVSLLQGELGPTAAEPLAYLTLEKLSRRGLLDTAIPPKPCRRDMLRKLAVAALPVIITIAAPRANAAASQAAACPSGQVMCNGTCIPPKGIGGFCGTTNCECSTNCCGSSSVCHKPNTISPGNGCAANCECMSNVCSSGRCT